MNMAFTRFKADKDIMDALVGLREKTGTGKRGATTAEDAAPSDVTMGYALC